MVRHARPALLTLMAAFAPYFFFDLLFQETVTTRYALPLVPPMAYLASRAWTGRATGFARLPTAFPTIMPA